MYTIRIESIGVIYYVKADNRNTAMEVCAMLRASPIVTDAVIL